MTLPSDPRSFIVARRNVIDIIDAGLSFYREQYQNIFLMLIFIYAPYYAIKFIFFQYGWISFERVFNPFNFFESRDYTITNILLLTADTSVTIVSTGALTEMMFVLARKNEIGFESIFRKIGSCAWPLIRINILIDFTLFAGFFLCFLPGVWLYVLFLFVTPVILFENQNRFRPIWKRSHVLIGGDWPRGLGFTALSWLLLSILGISLTYLLIAVYGIVLEQISWLSGVLPDFSILRLLSGVIISLLLFPMQSIFIVLFYFDIRSRKEGLDLQVLSERLI